MFNLKKIIISIGIIGIGGVVLAGTLPESFTIEKYRLKTDKLVSIEQTFNDPFSKEYIKNLRANDKAEIKSREIEKLVPIGKFIKDNIEVEIIGNIKAIEVNGQHGIELFARAWKDGKQLGFGKDGSVDIERFRFFNPPILVDDPNGDIIREWTDEITKELKQRKLREDPQEAIKQTLIHTIGLVGKENAKIIKGSIGNTTSTFYPDVGTGGTTVDGSMDRVVTGESWATIIAGAGTIADATSASIYAFYIAKGASTDTWGDLGRSIFLFNTAVIDTDDISSAIISFYGWNLADSMALAPNVDIYTSTPTLNNDLAASDFSQVGSTSQTGSPKAYADLSATDYVNFTFNDVGRGNIAKTGISKFGMRNANYDVSGTAPTWSNNFASRWGVRTADQTGTANDPKLVVVHSAVSSPSIESDLILFFE